MLKTRFPVLLASLVAIACIDGMATAQSVDAEGAPSRAEAIATGIALIVDMQEGDNKAEWPYEGVYRVRRQIPIGYRFGGTAICATALLLSPQYKVDGDVQAAVERAAAFIIDALEHPLMNPEYDGGYDVRGWGYTYGLPFLLEYRARAMPKRAEGAGGADGVDSAIRNLISAIERTEIPGVGGWAYARPAGKGMVAPPSPFMTAPTLLALYRAAGEGFDVDAEIVDRALKALTLSRTPSGSYVYSGVAGPRSRDAIPGAVGRMVAAEVALYLGGRSSQSDLRGSIDAFITHWAWLDKRRAQPGTHEPPYGVAPYYFYFAHFYAAMAVELLPQSERGEYRRRIDELLFSVRQEDGAWNDRVFARSANYGTSMATMSLMLRDQPSPSRWKVPQDPAETLVSPPAGSRSDP